MIFTIDHSTRTAAAFLELLQAHGIAYLHLGGLGGLRKPRRDSPNGGLVHEGFRGYADHMGTAAFTQALEAPRHELTPFARISGSAVCYPALV